MGGVSPSLRRSPPVDAVTLPATVNNAFSCSGPLDYWGAVRYSKRAGEVAEALAGLVRAGGADTARPLLERGIAGVLGALADADDAAGSLDDLLNRLLAAHAEACRLAPPEPLRLASWLVDVQFAGPWCPVQIGEYADPLTPDGLAAYRTEVRRRWAADPESLPARYAVEQLARQDRDVVMLVDVIGGDLQHPAQYGRLARALRDIGEVDAARQWAERGLAEHPDDPPGAGLRTFLARL
ncbi:hypothetical protein F4553_002610 [Allocatelliglobosispora scoriae]|uniref:Tetratricopeptide repeat protein n=1 Tax=Allocatelliglobosispora scoriae TaxID=643052 RepID=A0A841BQZ0_9ACTN|nr:hypothetical protein [Allocatelliglobosispora scoriae]MBB5869231.1 hypothetical protein [Allocatelliglobosispora scoriae]